MVGYIYLIIDLTNWKKYVGQHHYHLEKLDSNYHGSGTIISKIYKKRPHTLKEVYLKTCYTQEELDEWEKYFIFLYNTLSPNGYNLQEGGNGGVPCEEVRKKISETLKGKPSPNKGVPKSEEHKNKLSENLKGKMLGEKNPMFGKHHTEESKKKMCESKKNISDETRKKMSESHKGKPSPNKGVPKSEEHKKKISETLKGKPSPNKGVPMSEEQKKKLREAHQKRKLLKQLQPDGCLPLW